MNWRRYYPTYIAYAAGFCATMIPSWWGCLIAIPLVTLSQLAVDRVIRREKSLMLPEARAVDRLSSTSAVLSRVPRSAADGTLPRSTLFLWGGE